MKYKRLRGGRQKILALLKKSPHTAKQVEVELEKINFFPESETVRAQLSQAVKEGLVKHEKAKCCECGCKVGWYSLTPQGRVYLAWKGA